MGRSCRGPRPLIARARRAAAAVITTVAIACAGATPRATITRDRAIAIARTQVNWQPFETSAKRTSASGRAGWQVTLKGRLPGQPPPLFETAIVEIDAHSGAIVSVTKT